LKNAVSTAVPNLALSSMMVLPLSRTLPAMAGSAR
jgi:hypothetical protein